MSLSLEECLKNHREHVKTICVHDEEAQICLFCSQKKEEELISRAIALKSKLFERIIDNNNIMKDNLPQGDLQMKVKCPKCQYEWLVRVEHPKRCPRCGKWLFDKKK